MASAEFKTCTKCGTTHPISNFWKQSKAKDGYNTWCKPCVVAGLKEGARRRKRDLVDLFGGSCQRCGGVFNQAVYDFHHIDKDSKESSIAELIQSLSLNHPKVVKELSKCVMLCANCHRVVHANEETMIEENNECKNGICGI